MVMIVLVASFALILVDFDKREIDIIQDSSYISLTEQDMEYEEALNEENNSVVEVLL